MITTLKAAALAWVALWVITGSVIAACYARRRAARITESVTRRAAAR